MDPDQPSPSRRKVKFAPKAPPRRTRRLVTTEIEEDGGDEIDSQQFLARRVAEHLARQGGKAEKKAPVRVTFSNGAAETSVRGFDRQRERTGDGRTAAYSEASATGEGQNRSISKSDAETRGLDENIVDLTDSATVKKKKEYQEPWDYHHSYYPITLPLRRPYSGNPEVLDKAEFEEALEYDENSLSSASHLGLLDKDATPRMLVVMFPSNLPLGTLPTYANRREADANLKTIENPVKSGKGKGKEKVTVDRVAKSNAINGKEIAGSSMDLMSGHPLTKDTSFEELPEGYMGKMLVYRSGAVKLKLGEVVYDVAPGSDCSFPQKVMAINIRNKECCEVGDVNKRAVVTPDIDFLLNSPLD